MSGMKKIKRYLRVGVIIFACFFGYVFPLTIGSNTAVSVQTQPSFPTGTDNVMLGFARMENGFLFVDNKTTCSYNDFFSVVGTVNMNNGKLYLQQDITFDNPTYFINGGTIVGSDYAFELPRAVLQLSTSASPATTTLLAGGVSGFTQVANSSFVGAVQVNSMDWNFNNNYIALGSAISANQELVIYQFASNTLTVTKTLEQGVSVNSVRWHPTLNYLATARSATNPQVQVFNFNASTGSLTLTGSGSNPGANATAVAWHPSGQFLVTGTSEAKKEVVTYAFNTVTGTLSEKSAVNYAANTTVQNNAISFSPGGNLLAVGVSSAGADNTLQVFSFNAGILTTKAGVVLSGAATCLAVDWNPTGTYIAVGDNKAPQLNIYAYDQVANTLTLQNSITVGNANTVAWDTTGQYLAVGYTAAGGTDFKVYFFNPVDFTLTEVGTLPVVSNTNTFSSRWSRVTTSYLASGDAAGDLTIFVATGQNSSPLYFSDTRIIFNSDVNVNVPIHVLGNCIIDGGGHALSLVNNGKIIIRPASSLTLTNLIFSNLGTSNLQCLTDDGALVLENSFLTLARDYTFSRGSISFNHDVVFTGTNRFIYSSGLTSTIATGSVLYMGYNSTFSYAPRNPKQNLIFMTDPTSILYLDGSTLFSTRTGLQLSTGTLMLDDAVTLSSGARFSAEGMSLKSNLTVQVRGGANVNLFGIIRADQ